MIAHVAHLDSLTCVSPITSAPVAHLGPFLGFLPIREILDFSRWLVWAVVALLRCHAAATASSMYSSTGSATQRSPVPRCICPVSDSGTVSFGHVLNLPHYICLTPSPPVQWATCVCVTSSPRDLCQWATCVWATCLMGDLCQCATCVR